MLSFFKPFMLVEYAMQAPSIWRTVAATYMYDDESGADDLALPMIRSVIRSVTRAVRHQGEPQRSITNWW